MAAFHTEQSGPKMLKALIPVRTIPYAWATSSPSRVASRSKSFKAGGCGIVRGGRRSKQKDKGKKGKGMQAELDKLQSSGQFMWTLSHGVVRNFVRRRPAANSIIYMVDKPRSPVTTQLINIPAHPHMSTQLDMKGPLPEACDDIPSFWGAAMFPIRGEPTDGREASCEKSGSRKVRNSEPSRAIKSPICGGNELASALLEIGGSLEGGYGCHDHGGWTSAQERVTGTATRSAAAHEGSRDHLLQLIPTLQVDQNMFEIEMDNLTISLCKKVYDATGIPWKHHLCSERLPLFIYSTQSPRTRLDFQRFLRRSIKAHVQPLLNVLSEKRSLSAIQLDAAAAQEIDILVDYLSWQIPSIRPIRCKAACLVHEGPVAGFSRVFWLQPGLRDWISRKRRRTGWHIAYSRRTKSNDSRQLSLATFESAFYASTPLV